MISMKGNFLFKPLTVFGAVSPRIQCQLVSCRNFFVYVFEIFRISNCPAFKEETSESILSRRLSILSKRIFIGCNNTCIACRSFSVNAILTPSSRIFYLVFVFFLSYFSSPSDRTGRNSFFLPANQLFSSFSKESADNMPALIWKSSYIKCFHQDNRES